MKRIIGMAVAGLVAACGGSAPQNETPNKVTLAGSNFFTVDAPSGGVTVQISSTNVNPGATVAGTAITFMASGASCPASLPGGATVCVPNGYNGTTGQTLALQFSLGGSAAGTTYYYVLNAYNSGGTLVAGGALAPISFKVTSGAPIALNIGPSSVETSVAAGSVFTAVNMTGGEWFAYTGASAGAGQSVTFTATALTVPGGIAAPATVQVSCTSFPANSFAATATPFTTSFATNGDACTLTFATGGATIQVPLAIQNNVTQQPTNIINPSITGVTFGTTLQATPPAGVPIEPKCALPGTGTCGFAYKLPSQTTTKGNWAANTAYAVNDTVLSNGIVYKAAVAGTSAATALVGTRWAPSTTYTGAPVFVTDGLSVYQAQSTPCTSSALGSGPTGLTAGIADGSCTWNYATFIAPSTYVGPGSSAYPTALGIADGTVVWNYVQPTFVNGEFSVQYNLFGAFNSALPPSLKVASVCDYWQSGSPLAASAKASGNSTNYGDAAGVSIPVLWTEPTVQQIANVPSGSTLNPTWTGTGRTQCKFTLTLNNQGSTDAVDVYVEFN